MVVGWGTDNVLVATLDHQQMAILNARDKLHALTALPFVDGLGQCLVQVFYQHISILRLQISAVVSDYLAVFQRDDVTANGHIVVGHLVAYRCSLQGSASFIYLVQVIAENSRVGHFRPRWKSFRNRHQSACTSLASQSVHVFRTRILQQRLVSQACHLMVGHSVA